DKLVTGVQTCALPILQPRSFGAPGGWRGRRAAELRCLARALQPRPRLRAAASGRTRPIGVAMRRTLATAVACALALAGVSCATNPETGTHHVVFTTVKGEQERA